MPISTYEQIIAAPEDGAQGPMGRMPIMAGEYSPSVTYVCTDQVAPMVLFGGIYYSMMKNASWLGTSTGKTPAQDYAANGNDATWRPFEMFENIFVKILMAKLGLVGAAVFYEEFMFSQYGQDANGNDSNDYSKFASGGFIPNILLNFLTGAGHLACGGIYWDEYGHLYQRSPGRPVWRNLDAEIIAAGRPNPYYVDLKKGTYLSIGGDAGTVVLPDPATCQNVLIETEYVYPYTNAVSYLPLKCQGKLFTRVNGVKTYPTAVRGTQSQRGVTRHGTIRSVNDGSKWEWFADGDGLEGDNY